MMIKKLPLIFAIFLTSCTLLNDPSKAFRPAPTTTTTTCPQGMDLGSDMRCHY